MKERPLEFLVSQIELANKVYAETGGGLLEKVYNTYMQELTEIDPDHPLLQGIQKVQIKSNKKVTHAYPMLSLDKVYNIHDLQSWMVKISRPDEKFILMPKYDGIAGRLDVEGVLATRGDGETGEDISHRKSSLKYICNTDQGDNVTMAYDGEIVITKSDFIKHFESGEYLKRDGEKYKTPRNAVAGMMNSEDKIVGKILTFVDYNHLATEVSPQTVEFAVKALAEKAKDFPTDGFVVRVADNNYAQSLGHTSHHYKHSLALKHDNEKAVTKLIGVQFQMAKDHIGMVAKLEPIEINGVTISRVSLHNLDIIDKLGVEIGDTVEIERAGDVIPHLTRVVAKGPGIIIECTHCPSCRTPVVLDGQFYRCENDDCEDRIVNKIDSALKDLGSKGIAAETIRFLVQNGGVKNVADLFMQGIGRTMIGAEGYGERKIQKITDEISRLESEPKTGDQILAALNIPGFGRSLFKKLLKQVDFDLLIKLTFYEFQSLDQMSEIRGQLLEGGMNENRGILNQLLEIFTLKEQTKTINGGDTMHSVCFTGAGDKGRKEYVTMAEDAGWEVKSSVTSGLHYLVCADPESNSGKMKKARDNGCKVISYKDFEERM